MQAGFVRADQHHHRTSTRVQERRGVPPPTEAGCRQHLPPLADVQPHGLANAALLRRRRVSGTFQRVDASAGMYKWDAR